MDTFSELFENVLRICQSDPKVSEIGYNRWIKSIEPGEMVGTKVTLYAQTDFIRRTTQEIYGDVFERAFDRVLGFPVEIEFLVKDQDGYVEIEKQMNDLMVQHKRSDYELTFENFIKGKSNELAYAYCIAVSGKNNLNNQLHRSMFNPFSSTEIPDSEKLTF